MESPHMPINLKFYSIPERHFILTCNKMLIFSLWGEFVFLSLIGMWRYPMPINLRKANTPKREN